MLRFHVPSSRFHELNQNQTNFITILWEGTFQFKDRIGEIPYFVVHMGVCRRSGGGEKGRRGKGERDI